MQRVPHVILAALLAGGVALVTAPVCRAAVVLASGKLEACVNDGSTGETVFSCEEKLTATVAIQDGEVLSTSSLQVKISCIGSLSGKCPCECSFESDSGCTCRDLDDDVVLSLSKSPTKVTYPLTYDKSTPLKFFETYTVTQDGALGGLVGGGGGCDASPSSDSPTCGWVADGRGDRIPDSQGFCCMCSVSDGLSDLTGSPSTRRGDVSCSLLENGFYLGGSPGSAHCLNFSRQFYHGHTVGEARIDFDVHVHGSTVVTSVTPEWDLSVGPRDRASATPGGDIIVRLLGDLSGYSEVPVLAGKTLWIEALGQDEYVAEMEEGGGDAVAATHQRDPHRYVLSDPDMYSRDGSECNKINTGFHAFRNQPNRCEAPVGTCLSNGLAQVIREDDERIALGTTPRHRLHRFYGGSPPESFWPNDWDPDGKLWRLQIPHLSQATSLLYFEMRADGLRFSRNKSPGQIALAQVCTFGETQECGGFEAMTQRGYLDVLVQNSGGVAANYRVRVGNCTAGVLGMEEQLRAIEPGDEFRFTFELYMETPEAREDNECVVYLENEWAEVLDTERVGFYTTATQFSDGWDNSARPGESVAVVGGGRSCKEKCPGLFDVWCVLRHGCWKNLFTTLFTLGMVLVALVAAVFMVKKGWCTACRIVRAKQSPGLPARDDSPGRAYRQDWWQAPRRSRERSEYPDVNGWESPAGPRGRPRPRQ